MAEGMRRTFRSAEALRLEEIRHGKHWRRWGPYLSERQWGTVREDYSEFGNAWEYFPHDHARSRAYRWGEDGIGGFGDDHLLLCLGLALWNGRDPILKERLFGLTNSQGNHGEDVKELYYYLDGTPTHSYMRMLYKYPQAAFPYAQLVEENRRRGRADPEFELIDTGIFADNRYFDVEIEYAKADVNDILIQLTIHTRAGEAAMLHVLQQDIADPDARLVQRQALAGMLWSKQFYYFDIPEWLNGDPLQPQPPAARRHGRNSDWPHLNNADIVAIPDKWEYPWYAAWDLAFHAVTLALIDPGFAKTQLLLLTRDWYMHPNGQLPAYEWAFGDVHPPVHAWAAWRVYEIDREHRGGEGDWDFLERVFHKLMLNFTWWVNRKDVEGRNIFQGGFLGLDNIGIFDRNAKLPNGGYMNQADGTAWMAMYTLNLMRIALELALTDHVYEDIASKFFEHFLYIAEAMTNIGGNGIGLWDDEDEFYYDVVHLPDGERIPLRVRSLVGLIPLFAVEVQYIVIEFVL